MWMHICEQADEKTLMVVFRIDSSDGVPPFCVVHHRPKNYHSSFSTDGGYTWTVPAAMHDVNGRGMGTAYPRLLMLGGEDGVPKRLLLSGGRVYTEGIIDMEIWVSSDGMGKRWDQVHSVSYQHNRLAVSPVHKLSKFVNLTDGVNSTTSYVSLMKLDPQTALLVYECKDDPGSNYSAREGLEHFSMRITVT